MDLPRRLLRGGKRPRISLVIEAAMHSAVPAGKVVELEGCNYPGPQHRCARDPKKVWLSSMLAAVEAVRECTLLRVGDACVLQAGFDGSLVLGASVVAEWLVFQVPNRPAPRMCAMSAGCFLWLFASSAMPSTRSCL